MLQRIFLPSVGGAGVSGAGVNGAGVSGAGVSGAGIVHGDGARAVKAQARP